jgi:hypothetical protein
MPHVLGTGRGIIFVIELCGLALVLPTSARAQAQPPSTPPTDDRTTITVSARNWTRVEIWRFFEPHAGGGDPDYETFANRLFIGLRGTWSRLEWNAALQYVHLTGLPAGSIGPGPLGTGATYFDHLRETSSGHVYLRQLDVQVRDVLPRLRVRVGRMPYTSGAEAASGDAAIEAIKRQRLDSRLLGEFEWSIYQRAFDGVRVDWDSGARLHATGSALWPTQGGFEERAGRSLRDVRILGGTVNVRPSTALPHTELQGFVFGYDDARDVAARPDNTFIAVEGVDVAIRTFGGSVVGAYPVRGGRVDLLGWVVLQTGDWYDSSHGAAAFALEGGYQWLEASGRPWLRGGWNRASGDDDASDEEHGTFLPLLPTARKYALSATYAFMNLDDRFVQLLLRPHARVAVRADVHALGLSESADLWYAGSGATQRSGRIFGYAGRRSGGFASLATIVEGAADWTISPHWSINGYAGWMRGGDVVRSLFAGDRLTFAYVEHVVQF